MKSKTKSAENPVIAAESPSDLSFLKEVKLADSIKKLEELMSQNKRSFLLGAGCSLCAGLPLTTQLTSDGSLGVLSSIDGFVKEAQIAYVPSCNSFEFTFGFTY